MQPTSPRKAATLLELLVDTKDDLHRQNRILNDLIAAETDGGPLWIELQKELNTAPGPLLALLSRLPDTGPARNILQLVGVELGRSNRELGLRWAEALTHPAAQNFALAGIVESWASTAPEAASAWLELPRPLGDSRLQIRAFIHGWANAAPAAAALWLDRLSDPSLRIEGTTALGRLWGNRAPNASKIWAEQMTPGNFRDTAIVAVVEGWALRDAESAITWFFQQEFSADDQRVSTTYALASDYAGQKPLEAEAWLVTLPAGELRDEAILGFADTMNILDPERALRWLQSHSDREVREDRIADLMANWPQNASITAAAAFARLPVRIDTSP